MTGEQRYQFLCNESNTSKRILLLHIRLEIHTIVQIARRVEIARVMSSFGMSSALTPLTRPRSPSRILEITASQTPCLLHYTLYSYLLHRDHPLSPSPPDIAMKYLPDEIILQIITCTSPERHATIAPRSQLPQISNPPNSSTSNTSRANCSTSRATTIYGRHYVSHTPSRKGAAAVSKPHPISIPASPSLSTPRTTYPKPLIQACMIPTRRAPRSSWNETRRRDGRR